MESRETRPFPRLFRSSKFRASTESSLGYDLKKEAKGPAIAPPSLGRIEDVRIGRRRSPWKLVEKDMDSCVMWT
jgi:hypothetical protein